MPESNRPERPYRGRPPPWRCGEKWSCRESHPVGLLAGQAFILMNSPGGAVRNRTGTPSLPRTAATFRTTPWSRRESHPDSVAANDEGDLSHDPAPAPGIEPGSVVLEATLRPALAGISDPEGNRTLLAPWTAAQPHQMLTGPLRSPRRESNAVRAP